MNEENEVEEEASSEGNGEPGVPEEPVPVYKQENVPSGKVDQVMWYAFRGKSRKELEHTPYNFKPGTIRVAFNKLMGLEPGWVETQPQTAIEAESKITKQMTTMQAKSTQVFAKGSPPEAIIESISIPMIDGQSQGFEQGMKFGMTQLVLAVRIMQDLSSISLQQVKPLIDMTRSVREGEQAAFKGGADEAAMKAAQAMGSTIMPIMSDMQTTIANLGKSSEADPMKSMMVRTMEPLMKRMMGGLIPGAAEEPPSGWSKRTE